MHCYSQYHVNKDECRSCELLAYCKDSTESVPSLISNRAKKIPIDELAKPVPLKINNSGSKKLYTQQEMMELIAFLVAMDEKTLSVLSEKIQNPAISLADIGRKRNISRQAIHKLIKKRCEQIPELASVFNRKNEKNLTFMEAVCQIRQKSSELTLKEPVLNFNYCRSLISLNQSLDLSRLSIGKELNS